MILIGTPAAGESVTTAYHVSIFNLVGHFARRQPEVRFRTYLPACALVTAARNAAATKVLQDPTLSHLLFIDADMGFEPTLIGKMLALDAPLVGALVPKRSHDYGRMLQTADRFSDPQAWLAATQPFVGDGSAIWRDADERPAIRGSFVRVHRAGTGVLLIARRVLEQMREALPELWAEEVNAFYRGLGLTSGVFQPFEALRADGGLFLSEDYSFSRRWTDLGGEIWSCFDETVTHTGQVTFTGNYARRGSRDA